MREVVQVWIGDRGVSELLALATDLDRVGCQGEQAKAKHDERHDNRPDPQPRRRRAVEGPAVERVFVEQLCL